MKNALVSLFIIFSMMMFSGCGGGSEKLATAKMQITINQSNRNNPFPPVSAISSITVTVTGEPSPFALTKVNNVWAGSMTVHLGNNKLFTASAKNSVGKELYKGETTKSIVAGSNDVYINLYFADELAQVVSKVVWPGNLSVTKVIIKIEQGTDVINEELTITTGQTTCEKTSEIVIGTGCKVTVSGYNGVGNIVCAAAPISVNLVKDEVKILNFNLLPVQIDLTAGLNLNVGMPKVVITSAPILGRSGEVKGLVSGSINPSKFSAVLYARSNEVWGISDSLKNLTGSSFTFNLMAFDVNADKVAVILLPKDFSGNLVQVVTELPVPDGTYSVSIYDRVLARFRANSGVNLPWYNYGWDVGRHPWGGYNAGYSVNTNFAPDLVYLKSIGVNLVRIFVWCDLRSGVIFGTGNTTTFDNYALADFDAMVNIASEKDIKLLLVLFDWTIADGVSNETGGAVGEHPEVITDTAKTSALINLMKPLFIKYKDNQTIFGYDIINEPELATAVTQAQMKVFIQSWTTAIHSVDSDALVTVGSHMRTDVNNWSGIGLNFSQFHYYESAGFPEFDFPVSSIAGLENMAIVGEVRPEDIKGKLDTAYKNGCAGVLFWSLKTDYLFRPYGSVYKKWMSDHPVAQ